MMNKISTFLLATPLLLCSFFVNAQEAPAGGDEKSKIFKDQFTTIKNPFELRDPFRRKSFRSVKRIGLGKDYSYSNLPQIKPFTLDDLKVVGIFFGKERRAVAKIGNSNETFILKEGMEVGDNKAEIKAIMPGGIVVVERIRNVYDQEEILETIIPLSSATAK
jgi:Tfp pilus assembly protein PilP